MAEEVRLFTHKGASEYLGVHYKTLEYRVKMGLIAPMRMVNNDRMYTKESLDELKGKLEAGEGLYTIQEIADRFGIDYHRVYRAFRMRRKIEPIKKVGKVPLFNEEQVQIVAKLDGWQEQNKAE